MSEEVKEELSKFVALIGQDGRVCVKISGPHVNKKTFNRLILAVKKTYRNNIREYRKQVKRDMTDLELSNIVNEPTVLDVKPNKAVNSSETEIVNLEPAEEVEVVEAVEGVIPEEPIVVPIQDTPKRATLQEAIEAKRAKAKAKVENKDETKILKGVK